MKCYLGIDVSKGYADFVLVSDQLTYLEDAFQLDDTKAGHTSLKEWLNKLFDQHAELHIECAVESTGGFENNWYALLLRLSAEMSLRIARLNPFVVKHASKAVMNTNKTDAQSAFEIACYLKRYEDQVVFNIQDNQYSSFRSLFGHLTLLTRQKSQIINELKQLLYSSFPELQRFCKQSVPRWVLELLSEYPSPQKLAKAKAQKVSKIKGVTLEKAISLIETAKQTIGSKSNATNDFLIAQMTEDLMQKQKKIEALKEYLAKHCTGEQTLLLETIKGIGRYSAAAIMIQIEDIQRFATPKQLACYFGLHPVLKQSGDKKMESKMSKQGRPEIRAILFMCANSAVRCDDHLRAIYARSRAKGESHKHAIGVVMHKMIRIIWGVLNNQSPYDSKIDVANQQKNQNQNGQDQIAEIENKRRMQPFDTAAPISRMASKKRKAHATSQTGNAGSMRDLVHEPG